jgi:hypothetical protein
LTPQFFRGYVRCPIITIIAHETFGEAISVFLVVTLESGMSEAVWAGFPNEVLAAVLVCTLLCTAFGTICGLNSMITALILYGGVAALAIVWER